METFRRVIEGNSKAYMLLIYLLIAAERMLQKTGFLEVYTALKYLPFILSFFWSFWRCTPHTVRRNWLVYLYCSGEWIATFLSSRFYRQVCVECKRFVTNSSIYWELLGFQTLSTVSYLNKNTTTEKVDLFPSLDDREARHLTQLRPTESTIYSKS